MKFTTPNRSFLVYLLPRCLHKSVCTERDCVADNSQQHRVTHISHKKTVNICERSSKLCITLFVCSSITPFGPISHPPVKVSFYLIIVLGRAKEKQEQKPPAQKINVLKIQDISNCSARGESIAPKPSRVLAIEALARQKRKLELKVREAKSKKWICKAGKGHL